MPLHLLTQPGLFLHSEFPLLSMVKLIGTTSRLEHLTLSFIERSATQSLMHTLNQVAVPNLRTISIENAADNSGALASVVQTTKCPKKVTIQYVQFGVHKPNEGAIALGTSFAGFARSIQQRPTVDKIYMHDVSDHYLCIFFPLLEHTNRHLKGLATTDDGFSVKEKCSMAVSTEKECGSTHIFFASNWLRTI
ncbi:hypothetical protein BCR34DRAFT_589775 [Clohesyomyces aquaticus]|uniref:Uncharacterized protein n=1 Tax=Clohesyomyces aquaticus TaxID=1231657 RepID=A0A1Y1ZEJ9_9PLEO|nr:hypothetical protein BCR34DRAFT_589775 [Clohesyomyces aquaticus]